MMDGSLHIYETALTEEARARVDDLIGHEVMAGPDHMAATAEALRNPHEAGDRAGRPACGAVRDGLHRETILRDRRRDRPRQRHRRERLNGSSADRPDAKAATARRLRFGRALDESPELNPTQKLVGRRLLEYMKDGTGVAWPSVETLADKCKRSDRTVQRACRQLDQTGWFQVLVQPGRTHSNRYMPRWEKVTPASPIQPEKVTTVTGKGDNRDAEKVTTVSPNSTYFKSIY